MFIFWSSFSSWWWSLVSVLVFTGGSKRALKGLIHISTVHLELASLKMFSRGSSSESPRSCGVWMLHLNSAVYRYWVVSSCCLMVHLEHLGVLQYWTCIYLLDFLVGLSFKLECVTTGVTASAKLLVQNLGSISALTKKSLGHRYSISRWGKQIRPWEGKCEVKPIRVGQTITKAGSEVICNNRGGK